MDEQEVARSLSADREATLTRIASMTADLEGVTAAATGSNVDDEHDPEGSTIAFEREQLAALLASARDHLKDIDAALERLSANRYGICTRCGNPISAERLAALPATQFCVTCAAQLKR